MNSILRNQSDKRLRAGWRILLFIFIFWSFSALSFVIKPLFGDLTRREYISNYSLIIVVFLAIGATLGVFLARKYFDRKSMEALGLKRSKRSFQDVIFGFLLSGLMAGLFLFISYLFGVVDIEGINLSTNSP